MLHFHNLEGVKKVIDIAKEAQEKDIDSVYVVIGRPGMGKSMFVLWLMDWLKAEQKHIALEKADVGKCLKATAVKGAFQFDEAIDGLNSKEGMSKFNVQMEKLFEINRGKLMISFIVLPRLKLLSPLFREDRLIGLFEVKKRGSVLYYDRKEIDKINFYMQTHNNKFGGGRPVFVDTYKDYTGRLREEYKARKAKRILTAEDFFIEQTEIERPKKKEKTKKEQAIELLKMGHPIKVVAKELKSGYEYVRRINSEI
jgi:hypothetical protein